MNTVAVNSYVEKWLSAYPAQRFAVLFVEPARRPGDVALAALQHELVEAACGIREPQVAAAKLNWWAEELAGAPASGGRHPLTRALFGTAPGAAVATVQWLAPVHAALAQLDTGTPADFAAQIKAAESLHGALAALETAWWFGPRAQPDRAARMATLGHLLHSVARVGEQAAADRLPLPMARLARHGLDRDGLGKHSPARSDALREQLRDIGDAFAEAWDLPGPLATPRGLDARLSHAWSQRAARGGQPLRDLHVMQSRQTGPATLWRAWRAARAARAFRT